MIGFAGMFIPLPLSLTENRVMFRCACVLALAGVLLHVSTVVQAEGAKLKIGFIVSLSGPVADWGKAIQQGVELAREDHPEIDGVFEAIFEDSQYIPKTAVTNLEKLRSVDRIDAVYVFGGPISYALAPIAESFHLPMFSTEYDPQHSRGRKYVTRFANDASDYGKAIVLELRRRGLKKFAIVKSENQYHNTLSSALINSLSQEEVVKVLNNFDPGEMDFRSVFPALRAENYDAIGVYIVAAGHHAFFSQARSAGIRFKNLFGTNGFESVPLNRGIEDAVEGALFANTTIDPGFRERYRRRFGDVNQIVDGALAYEFAILVNDLFRNSKRPSTPEELQARFALTSSRNSVCGEYVYRDTPESGKHFSFPIVVGEMRQGNPRILSTTPVIEPQ
jgi:branched-chain amino acid transport system substrate-binding protein